MTGELLALGNAAALAASNVLGGVGSRRGSPLQVLVVSAPVAAIVAVVAAFAVPGEATWDQVGWGALAGIAGGLGLPAAYRAMATGEIGMVVPIIASTATIVQIGVAWVWRGELASGVVVGALLCLLGVAFSSWRPSADARPQSWQPVVYAALAGSAFASFVLLMSRSAGSGFWGLAAARLSTLAVACVLVLLTGTSLRLRAEVARPAAFSGALEITGNCLLVAALSVASVATVAVIGAISPVLAALIAWAFLKERLRWPQLVGLALAFAGVFALVAN